MVAEKAKRARQAAPLEGQRQVQPTDGCTRTREAACDPRPWHAMMPKRKLLYKAGMCTSGRGLELKSSNLALNYNLEFVVTRDYCFHVWIAIPPSTRARTVRRGGRPNSWRSKNGYRPP